MLKILINCFKSTWPFSSQPLPWSQQFLLAPNVILGGLKDIMHWDSWDRVNCLAELKGEISLNRLVIVQVAEVKAFHTVPWFLSLRCLFWSGASAIFKAAFLCKTWRRCHVLDASFITWTWSAWLIWNLSLLMVTQGEFPVTVKSQHCICLTTQLLHTAD